MLAVLAAHSRSIPRHPLARHLATSATRSRAKGGLASDSTSNHPTTSPGPARPAKNPFAAPANSVLAYVGPYSAPLRQAKSVAFVFGACGCMAVPATLFLGNTEYLLASIAGFMSLSPSILLHALFRHDVTKIYAQGSPSTKSPGTIRVSTIDPIKLVFEKLSWRGVTLHTQVLSTNLFVQAKTAKSLTWTTTSATSFDPSVTSPSASAGARSRSSIAPQPRPEIYRINKEMMMSNPSFAFVAEQIEHQSRLSHNKYNAEDNQLAS
ncbi:hypothetical protein B0O80DRAFT_500181 [Mortierella sp. GBAus27b]|nr:hypothetical protein BGX31_009533 [Mortierella sp. GBA43]KAI8351321.1 hypothetical protein B0O80DRAFT_500181 [Mortierella sp. GBAus27b]